MKVPFPSCIHLIELFNAITMMEQFREVNTIRLASNPHCRPSDSMVAYTQDSPGHRGSRISIYWHLLASTEPICRVPTLIKPPSSWIAFINLAKEGYETYSKSQSQSQSQSNVHKTGGREYNSPDNRGPSQSFRTSYNSEEVSQHVDSDNHGFLDKALSHAHRTVQQQGDIDEDGVQNLKNAHHQAFSSEGQGPGGMAPDALGGAAAFKVFTDMMKGGGSSGGGGGDMQSKLIGMAMQHASKLFDQSGGGSGEEKQSAMNSAATYVMQLMMKKEMNNFIGGGNSGGLGWSHGHGTSIPDLIFHSI
ncbi:uncharacterized protein EDB91DRAFT_1332702 [Suillus paluster]|uniref:uncharacterized protein n=1 Tax=Suillus paluster TaxID=48578 RepID=UPI001B879444|nr:uncharacterized protein EDB91DRAFT_1332702 [Suillus paluster]KAG1754859.1 hypothetical protein EDB91DRAFT_1332702 [Suillus paluster]